jgi:hypothetical protein
VKEFPQRCQDLRPDLPQSSSFSLSDRGVSHLVLVSPTAETDHKRHHGLGTRML